MTDGNDRLRVAYVLLRPPSYSETFIVSEIRAVGEAGATVEVFAARTREGRFTDAARILGTLVRHPLRLLSAVRTLGPSYLPRGLLAGTYAIALVKQVRRFAPDVVHAHFVNLPTAVAILVARELGIPVTAMAHAADFLLDRDVDALRRRLSRLSQLFVISDSAARQLGDRGVDMSGIPHRVVRAAFDGAVTAPAPRVTGDAIRLVTVARLVEKKGIDTILAAVARLTAAGLPVRYDLYGDGPLRDELGRLADSIGVSSVVTFHGAVPHATATAALATADVAVLACRTAADGDLDGIPVFLMEAGSRGVPVVSTAVSGIPELVGHDGGWLVPAADPDALADAVRQAAADPDEAGRRARVLQARIRAEFSPAEQAGRLIATWSDLAGRRQPVEPVIPDEARSAWH
ncbi:glycosyltransferase [Polymorphospora rubra]|uniref:glycosyltransferase n=1 Tax=Polymorphospora rubra TaxID=338584 RepID=UPI0033D14949